MTVYELKERGGDFLVHYESEGVCFRSCKLKTPSGAAVAEQQNLTGYPVVISDITDTEPLVAVLALAGEENSANGFIVHGPTLPALLADEDSGPNRLYQILVAGPALVAVEGIAKYDVAGDPFVTPYLKDSLETMGVRVKDTVGLTSPTTTTSGASTTTTA